MAEETMNFGTKENPVLIKKSDLPTLKQKLGEMIRQGEFKKDELEPLIVKN